MRMVCVTISSDPKTLGVAANEDDLGRYCVALERKLRREFPTFQIQVVAAPVELAMATDPEVRDRVREIEATDEWLELLG